MTVSYVKVLAALGGLPNTTSAGTVHGLRLGTSGLIVAKDVDHFYLLLGSHSTGTILRLDAMELRPDVPFEWTESGSLRSARVMALSAPAGSPSQSQAFATLVQSVVDFAGQQPSPHDVFRLLEAWATLLQAPLAPSRADLIGFWGECLVVREAPRPVDAVLSWQWQNADLIDFVHAQVRLEVKTSTTNSPQCTVSLSQLREGVRTSAGLMAIATFDDPTGLSLKSLIAQVVGKLAGHSVATATFGAVVARRVGLLSSNWDVALDEVTALAERWHLDFAAVPFVDDARLESGRLTFDIARCGGQRVSAGSPSLGPFN